jgi:hypothetical protein
MRRNAALLALTLAASVLAGCVYDPYSGTWVPCCNYYGYPYYRNPYYYRYPPPYYPYGYPSGPYMTPPPTQPGAYRQQGDSLDQRFSAANVTHDGRLTREQAGAGMPLVAQDFDAIDIDHKGYVTLPEVRAFAAQHADAGQPGTR